MTIPQRPAILCLNNYRLNKAKSVVVGHVGADDVGGLDRKAAVCDQQRTM